MNLQVESSEKSQVAKTDRYILYINKAFSSVFLLRFFKNKPFHRKKIIDVYKRQPISSTSAKQNMMKALILSSEALSYWKEVP